MQDIIDFLRESDKSVKEIRARFCIYPRNKMAELFATGIIVKYFHKQNTIWHLKETEAEFKDVEEEIKSKFTSFMEEFDDEIDEEGMKKLEKLKSELDTIGYTIKNLKLVGMQHE